MDTNAMTALSTQACNLGVPILAEELANQYRKRSEGITPEDGSRRE